MTPATLKRYQKVLKDFVDWLDETDENPDCAEQVDDLIVAYEQDQMLSKSTLENLVAAVGFCWPRFRGHLIWSKAVLAGWAVAHTARHTVPLPKSLTRLTAAHLTTHRHARLGVGLLVQQRLGLRPNEMLNLLASDITLPEHSADPQRGICVVGLGFRVGTKAKRAQMALLEDPDLIALVR